MEICAHESSCRDVSLTTSLKRSSITDEHDHIEDTEEDAATDDSGSYSDQETSKERAEPNGRLHEKYMANDSSRTLLMCSGDRDSTLQLARLTERLEHDEEIRFSGAGLATCPRCGPYQLEEDMERLRPVRLFTLSHGSPNVLFTDWRCRKCRKWV